MTASFKLRKVDLQRQGYDPTAFDDPLYLRDEDLGAYVPWSRDVLAKVGYAPFCAQPGG